MADREAVVTVISVAMQIWQHRPCIASQYLVLHTTACLSLLSGPSILESVATVSLGAGYRLLAEKACWARVSLVGTEYMLLDLLSNV